MFIYKYMHFLYVQMTYVLYSDYKKIYLYKTKLDFNNSPEEEAMKCFKLNYTIYHKI